MRTWATRTRGQGGFTLVELLVVIAVLGSLSGVAVVAVGGIEGNADTAACAADARVLRTAAEAHFVQEGSYVDEDGLVAAGLLDGPSDLHDVEVTGLDYQIVPVGDCVGGTEEVADGGDEAGGTDEAQAAADAAAKEAAEKAAAEAAEKDAAEQLAAEKAAAEAAEKEAAEKDADEKKDEDEKDEDASGCGKDQIDINSADKKALSKIDHVGGDEATRITKQRPFKSLEQLTEVKGLDEGDVKDIISEGLACVA